MSNPHAEWLPLTDYATKYKVSVSTLRRRIKAEDIQFRFEDGKYLLIDEPSDAHQKNPHRPSLYDDDSLVSTPVQQEAEAPAKSQEGVFSVAQRFLEEIKKAYSAVLHEKEDHITTLKGEISDLQTLVKVLETENDRLRRRFQENQTHNNSQQNNNQNLS
ncbi:MAG: hypothetical protein V4736_02855 [Bdellovibrionota bacterium]